MTCGPFVPERTSVITALMREPCSYRSPSTCSERGSSDSTLPRSTSTLLRSPACCTMPVTTSPTRSMYSSYIIRRSSSRIRCRMTCFAVCAAMRPKPSGVTSSRRTWLSGMSDQSMSRSSSEMSVCWRSPVSSSSRSSSSSLRSRASSSRRSSMSAGNSIEKTRKSPPSSISTVACREAPGVFLYAASSASSRAVTSAPSSMPLSRSISRTASMISWLISHPLVDQVAPHDRLVRNVHVGAVDADAQLVRARLGHLTLEPGASGERLGRAQRDRAADDAREVLRLAQRTGGAGRGDVDRVLAQVLAQQVGDAGAQRVVDALGMIDVDAEARRRHQLERDHLDARQVVLDPRRDLALQLPLSLVCRGHQSLALHKKWARRPTFQTAEMWCGQCSNP